MTAVTSDTDAKGLHPNAGETLAERRRKKLQQALVGSLIGIETFLLTAKHFIIPPNSVCDKLPHFRNAVGSTNAVMLSQPFQALMRVHQQGPLPTEIAPRPKHRFLVRRPPGLFEVVGANLLLCYTLTKIKM